MINYRTGGLNLYSNYSWRSYLNNGSGWQKITTDSLITESNSDRTRQSKSNMIKLGADINFTPKTSISTSLTYNLYESNHSSIANYMYFEPDYDIIIPESSVTQSSSERFGSGNSMDWLLGFYKDFANPLQKLTIEANQTISNGENESIRIDYISIDSLEYTTKQDDEYTNTTFQLDYTHPFGEKIKTEFGVKSYMKDVTKTEVSFEYPDSMKFQYNEDIVASYLIIGYQLNHKLGLQLGVRAEQAETIIDTGDVIKNTYNSIFPSGHIQFAFSKRQEIQLSFSKRVNRPNDWHINPFKRRHSPTFERHGNPYLKPEYIDSWDLSYSAYGQMVSVYVKDVTDLIRHYRFDSDSGLTVLTFRNMGDAQQSGIEFVSRFKPFPFWSFMASVNAFQTKIYSFSEDVDNESELNPETKGVRGRISSTISLPSNIEIQMSSRFRAPMEVTQSTIGGMGLLDIAIEKTILNSKGSILFKIGDVFETRKFSITSENFESWRRRQDGRTYSLNFTYQFGEMKDRKKSGRRQYNGSTGTDSEGDGY